MTPDEIHGLISNELGAELRRLASEVPPGRSIVELGSYTGKSTSFLAAGAQPGVPVYAVDLWDDPRNIHGRHGYNRPEVRERFEAQLIAAGLHDRVIAWRADTREAAGEYVGPPVGLLYVDANHSAEGVMGDLVAWRPHLAAYAIVAFDDYETPRNPGVKLAVDGFAAGLPNGWSGVEVLAGQLAVVRMP